MTVCPSCERESPPDFAFCPGCGAKLGSGTPGTAESPSLAGPRPLAEERKVVTTLCCDLVSFTSHSEASDHELIDALLQSYDGLARKLVKAHGGVVEKFIGDAVLAVFGFPRAHEDDAERAVRCALKLVVATGELVWPDGEPVKVRVGVNTGETYVHTGVDPASGETFLTGDAVNTAARLETAAPPGGVVVGGLTHSLTVKAVVYEELEPLSLKGKSSVAAAWLAKEVDESRSRTGVRTSGKRDTPFLGRGAELHWLQQAFDVASTTAQAQCTLLVGEPGIGKSRLVLEFARTLDERPEPIIWRQGRCLPYGEGVAFWALGEIVKAHAGILENDDVAIVQEKLEAILPEGDQRPWFRQRLRPLLGLQGAQVSREESFAAWTSFLADLAKSGPTVLVFEDLHWAGDGMLAYLEHLAAQDLAAPLLVVATTRPELLTQHPGIFAPAEGVGRLTLTPLSHREAGRLVSALLEERLAANVRDPVIERAGGNPLYAEEYVRLLIDRGLLIKTRGTLGLKDGAELPLPDTVQAVLAARLDTLPAEHKALMCDAAVFGESFWAGGVAALAAREARDVDDAMVSLAERQLVRPAVSSTLEGETEYLFWHALARDVAYEQLPRKARARKHEEAARWIETQAGERSQDVAEVLAHHYVTALDLARILREADLAERLRLPTGLHLVAAGAKTQRLDLTVAVNYLTRGVELLPENEFARAQAHYLLAEAFTWRGQPEEAVSASRQAVASMRAAGALDGAADCLVELSTYLNLIGDPGWRSALDEALQLMEGLEPSEHLMYANQEAACMFEAYLLDHSRAIEYADRAIQIAERLDRPVPPEALEWRGMARLNRGDAGWMEDLELALAEATAQGLGTERVRLTANFGAALTEWRGPLAGLPMLRDTVEFSRRSGMEFWVSLVGLNVCWTLVGAGQWDEALAEISALGPAIVGSGYVENELLVDFLQASLAIQRGDVEVAAPLASRLIDAAFDESTRPMLALQLLSTAAEVKWRAGDAPAAIQLLDEIDRRWPITSCAFVSLLPDPVRLAVAAGRVNEAVRWVDASVSASPTDKHAFASVTALLAEAHGEFERAADGFADAATRWHDFGVPYEEGQALLGQGRCLVALGRAPEGAAPLTAARDIFARLGAKPALTDVDRLLDEITPSPH